MGHPAEARPGRVVATLSVEGRSCAAHVLPGSALGSATGLAVVVDRLEALHDALTWLPGRILVVTGDAASSAVLATLLQDRPDWSFGAIVVLTDESFEGTGMRCPIPLVRVTRLSDRECVRRAVRLSVAVGYPAVAPSLPARGVDRRRRVAGRAARGVPGTIHHGHPA